MPRVYLSLGSNVDPEDNLRLGVAALQSRYGCPELSPVYRSKAVGFDGDDFLNLVASVDTADSIEAIAEHIETIHRLAGRDRSPARYSSRTLDIDLLTWGDAVLDGEPLVLPRDDILRYAFVLKPLTDIAADDRHPVTGRTYASHWEEMSTLPQELHRVALDLLPASEQTPGG